MKVIKTLPTCEPITYLEVCDHLQINTIDESFDTSSIDYINRQIKATRKWFEETVLGRALNTQTWYYYLDNFPCENFISIPYPPLQASPAPTLKYTDTDGTQSTWASTNYTVDNKNEPGRIVLTYLNSWPTVTLSPDNPIVIEFVCGYGNTPEDVPEGIKYAMLVSIADLYEHRGDITFKSFNNIKAVERLVGDYRIRTKF
jgi:uncharacterized phiE125 gp8 family phage protein